MATAVITIASIVIAVALFMPAWRAAGPRVYRVTKSHAAQLGAMAGVFLVLLAVSAAVLTTLASLLLSK